MASFHYRCPNTAVQVQGWFDDADTDTDDNKELYQGEYCPACSKFHFVNPRTGKILSFGKQ